jgi:hypothetical protein
MKRVSVREGSRPMQLFSAKEAGPKHGNGARDARPKPSIGGPIASGRLEGSKAGLKMAGYQLRVASSTCFLTWSLAMP